MAMGLIPGEDPLHQSTPAPKRNAMHRTLLQPCTAYSALVQHSRQAYHSVVSCRNQESAYQGIRDNQDSSSKPWVKWQDNGSPAQCHARIVLPFLILPDAHHDQ